MTSAVIGTKKTVAPLRSERTLHVCVLSAFAFSEPLFAALTQQFVYLHDIQAGWTEIAVVILVLAAVIPAAFVLLDQLLLRWSSSWGGYGRDSVLVILSFLVALSILRPLVRIRFLVLRASVWLVTLAIAVPSSMLFVSLYRRSQWMHYWISAATVGLICFPGLFAYRYALLRQSDSAQQQEALAHRIPVEHPVPVIMIVFDEFSGTTLMNRNLELDAVHFPQFARLGEISTWYRNASTVHCRTDVAVPAILSGQFPTIKRPPLEAEYPGNLLQTIQRTEAFDMVVFEPITRLCPISLKAREQHLRTFTWKIASLTKTIAAVYPRLIFPDDMPIDFPPISRLWFGLPENETNENMLRTGLIRHLAFREREYQLAQFIHCIQPLDRPRFSFLHIELPHLPWGYLPSGHQYNTDPIDEFHPLGAWGDIGEDWDADPGVVARNEHRYLKQVGFVDRFIGQLLDHLQENALLDQCLLIVTADHGVAFRPNHSRRVPAAETLPEIMSVPLFIKWPGQKVAKISDDNVESVDILPTVAEILGLTLNEPVDGTSVTNEKRRLRKSLYVDEKLQVLEPVIPRLEAAVQRRLAIFGSDSWDCPPQIAATHPEWHGRLIRDFTVEDRPLAGVSVDCPIPPLDATASEFVPCLVRGFLDPRRLQTRFADLVLVLNDVICDSGRSCPNKYGQQGFEFLISETTARQLPGRVELFLVNQENADSPRLRRIATLNLPVK